MMGGLTKPGTRMRRLLARRAVVGAGDPQAFTIIEVLIVLAVTGLLFVSAAVMISGRQNQTAFDQSIQQIQAQIRQTINDVAVGYLPKSATFQCIANAGGPQLSSGGAGGQGTNNGCIFLGKAIQFDVASGGGTGPEQFATFTIAGLQQGGAGGLESSNLAEALPKAVAPSTSEPSLPSLTVFDTLQNGLTTAPNPNPSPPPAYGMWYNNGGADKPIGAVAFTSSLASFSGGTITSGSQQVNVVPVGGSTLGADPKAIAEAIKVNLKDPAQSPPNPINGVSICFVSGGTNQSGLITIGGTNREIAVNLSIKSNKLCR